MMVKSPARRRLRESTAPASFTMVVECNRAEFSCDSSRQHAAASVIDHMGQF